jgi:hypothetical protein
MFIIRLGLATPDPNRRGIAQGVMAEMIRNEVCRPECSAVFVERGGPTGRWV